MPCSKVHYPCFGFAVASNAGQGAKLILILITMNYDDYKLQTPDSLLNEIEEQKVYRCSCCNDPVLFNELFELGINTYGLKSDAMACGYCLNELHNNLTLTN